MSLRYRIVAAYVLLTCAVCGCFAIVAFFALQAVEDRMIDQRLSQAAPGLIERYRQGLAITEPGEATLYHGRDIPPALTGLKPGVYDTVIGDSAHQALIVDDKGERYAIAQDDSDYERIKRSVYEALAVAVPACLLLAVLLGRITASRVIAPVTALADAVRKEDMTSELPSLRAGDEIGVLARAFAARTNALGTFLARERLFAGDVSHELRTPLTVILGAAELLQARLHGKDELLPIVERVRRTAADTADRIGALLLLSRAPESVDAPRIGLTPLIEQEMERHRPLLEGKPVELQFESSAEVYVFAQPELVGIAVGNLIRNACQFTEQGRVTVRLLVDALVVEDTGVGIPLAIRERLFERFVRGSADPLTGSGLGLAIVRRVADHLGWRVSVEDREGGGSRFIVLFSPAP